MIDPYALSRSINESYNPFPAEPYNFRGTFSEACVQAGLMAESCADEYYISSTRAVISESALSSIKNTFMKAWAKLKSIVKGLISKAGDKWNKAKAWFSKFLNWAKNLCKGPSNKSVTVVMCEYDYIFIRVKLPGAINSLYDVYDHAMMQSGMAFGVPKKSTDDILGGTADVQNMYLSRFSSASESSIIKGVDHINQETQDLKNRAVDAEHVVWQGIASTFGGTGDDKDSVCESFTNKCCTGDPQKRQFTKQNAVEATACINTIKEYLPTMQEQYRKLLKIMNDAEKELTSPDVSQRLSDVLTNGADARLIAANQRYMNAVCECALKITSGYISATSYFMGCVDDEISWFCRDINNACKALAGDNYDSSKEYEPNATSGASHYYDTSPFKTTALAPTSQED